KTVASSGVGPPPRNEARPRNIALRSRSDSGLAQLLEAPAAHLKNCPVEPVRGDVQRSAVQLVAVESHTALGQQPARLGARQAERLRHQGRQVDLTVLWAEG